MRQDDRQCCEWIADFWKQYGEELYDDEMDYS